MRSKAQVRQEAVEVGWRGSFFSTLKSELDERFDSHGEARMELFDDIEVLDNQKRRHSTIGQISPAEYERQSQVA